MKFENLQTLEKDNIVMLERATILSQGHVYMSDIIIICSLTSSNYKGADAAVFAVPRPHRTGMSVIQELTPYPRGYNTNWCTAASAVQNYPSVLSAYRPGAAPSCNDFGINPYPLCSHTLRWRFRLVIMKLPDIPKPI